MDKNTNSVVFIIYCIFFIITILYFFFNKRKMNKQIYIVEKQIKDRILKSQLISSKMISEAEKKIYLLKKETENDLNERRKIIVNLEEKMIHKEELLTFRTGYLSKKEELLYIQENKLKNNKNYIEKLENKLQKQIYEQMMKLEEISFLTFEEARKVIMQKTEQNVFEEMQHYIKKTEEEYKYQVQKKAKMLLVSVMQKISRKTASEQNISMIFLEKDDLKGRIIGKDGRNIKTFELITGVDLIIDDAPNIVILSSFDPIRREIAKITLENLILDGRITPSSIEIMFKKKQNEIDDIIKEIGEESIYESKIGIIDEELVQLLGKLKFRTSYGQNILQHSLEVSFIAGKLAAEIGENEILARRAGLLHDIGKALDYQIEGSHVEIGINLAAKYKESDEVIDAIASHHEDKEPSYLISVLVIIADAVSSARPGARRETLENYIQRIQKLEQITNKIEGVEKSYAIKSGREIRVIVKAEETNDLLTFAIAKKIKKQIQTNINYNGNIKIIVIRELRVNEIAEVNNLSINKNDQKNQY
ncbi:ribonuclease Y [Candidatus Phytoplasma pini]|uniref:Ribonuclease Y n=1 Tax=Candidatus Phytoplasma pini TaxID=267362 RepID=A0A559KJA6_9MOLU|nr:ribonuclease Y [Candidatus Phytoplasma pini]TVY12213.1 Ribonuclease Y [Candidatus Phytoplasma pini]